MDKNKSGRTAYGVATLRLIEQYQSKEKRLFTDPVIKYLLPHSILSLMKIKIFRIGMRKLNDVISKGIYGWLMCRTKYIDVKTGSVLHNGIRQLIIPGAGLDTRAYRIEGIAKVNVFEIDLTPVQEFKKERIIQQFGSLPSHVTYVPINFNQQSLHEALCNCQFDFSKPTLAIWEGVTQYLSRDAVEKIFDFFSAMPEGSYILFTYVLESVINKKSEIKGANRLVRLTEKTNTPWIFGMEPSDIITWLEKYNMSLIEDIGADYCQENYLRPINRQLDVTEMERVVFAKVKSKV